MSAPNPARSPGPPLFAVGAFWAFVLGGLAFGALFIVNWRAVAVRVQERPPGSLPSMVTVGAGPVSVSVPVTISPPAIAIPAKPAEVSSGIVNVVKTVLPDWSGSERFTVLLLGIDKRDDEPINGTRSDT